MSERKNRNWLVKLYFLDSIVLLLYVFLVFSVFGLIFWEIAFIFAILNVIGIVWSIRRIIGVKKERIAKYRHKLVVFSLIVLIGFNIFAIIPFFFVNPLGNQFEQAFQEELGPNYFENIPQKYVSRLKAPGRYYGMRDLSYFINPSVSVDPDIKYGPSAYEKYDKYEDTTITDSNKPALIFFHGGGSIGISTEDTFAYVFWCKYFASLGFISFSVEFTPCDVEIFPRAVKDVRTAIVHIKSHASEYNLDNSKVALMGGSFGGHMATLCAYTGFKEDSWWRTNGGDFTWDELKVECVVDLYGAVNQLLSYHKSVIIARTMEIKYGGSPYESIEIMALYEKHLPKNYLSADQPPTLIIHGFLDRMVSVEESRDLYAALEAVGAPNIYLEVPFGQHAFEPIPGTPGNQLVFYFVPRFVLSVLFG